MPVQVVTAAAGTYSQTLIAEMDKTEAPTLFVIGNSMYAPVRVAGHSVQGSSFCS